eukprot:2988435-Heterocapsa_arctica.AAC.1
MDLDRPSVVAQLAKGIKEKRYGFLHSSIPCTSWSALNRTNCGTRRKHCPDEGPNPLPREVLGNRQAATVARLCLLHVESGGHLSIENPRGSNIFQGA